MDNALSELHKSLAYDNQYGETYYLFGFTFLKYGDHYIAVGNISKAIDVYYTDSLYYFNKAEQSNYAYYTNIFFDRGRAYSGLGNSYKNSNAELANEFFHEAMKNYEFCLEHNYPHKTNAYLAIAEIYYEMGSYLKAIQYYTNALKADALETRNRLRPVKNVILLQRSDAHYRLGVSYFNNKDYSSAVQCYIDAINDNHENYQAQFELGKAYLAQDMLLESIRQFDLIIERCSNKSYQDLARDGRNLANSKLK